MTLKSKSIAPLSPGYQIHFWTVDKKDFLGAITSLVLASVTNQLTKSQKRCNSW